VTAPPSPDAVSRMAGASRVERQHVRRWAAGHAQRAGGAATGGGTGSAAGGAPRPPAAAPNLATTARFSFEDGADTWGPFWHPTNLQYSTTTQLAYDGTHSLLLDATPGANPPAIGTDHISGLAPGMTVTLHLHYDGQGQGQIEPFVQDPKFNRHWPRGCYHPARRAWLDHPHLHRPQRRPQRHRHPTQRHRQHPSAGRPGRRHLDMKHEVRQRMLFDQLLTDLPRPRAPIIPTPHAAKPLWSSGEGGPVEAVSRADSDGRRLTG
jgi:hypothetical protein